MAANPNDWNVVVVGAWNLAILTPEGIKRRLFELSQATPVEVQVAIDQQAPIRVLHSGLTVIPSRNTLVVEPVSPGAGSLRAAAAVLARAVRLLPETPMTAAGVNVRYRLDPVPDDLIHVVESDVDTRLADLGFAIQHRGLLRRLAWNQGVINCEWHTDESGSRVGYNFHLSSSEPQQLAAWVEQSEAMVAEAARLTREFLHVEVTEGEHAIH
jgi:hypothetical protein